MHSNKQLLALATQAVASGHCLNRYTNGVSPQGNGIDSIGKVVELTAARRTLPTIQTFTSGSGTYPTPANVLWIEIEVVGGGGGGGGSSTTTAGGGGAVAGNDSTLSTLTGFGGGGSGQSRANGGGGGGATGGNVANVTGGQGGGSVGSQGNIGGKRDGGKLLLGWGRWWRCSGE